VSSNGAPIAEDEPAPSEFRQIVALLPSAWQWRILRHRYSGNLLPSYAGRIISGNVQETRRFSELAGRWRAIRSLLPVYANLAEQFRLPDPPVKNVAELQGKDEATINAVLLWMDQIDDAAEPHHFRHLLQAADVSTPEDKLAILIRRFLGKPHDDRARDKLDFFLTQYVAVCAPPMLYEVEPSLEEIGRVLEPVLGECPCDLPQWLESMEQLVEELRACGSLRDLQGSDIITRGRQLKISAGKKYFGHSALLAFARFNFMVRQHTYRLLQCDVQAIERTLAELAQRGVHTLDCRELELSSTESLADISQLCEVWKRPSVTEYTHFQYQRLLDLRQFLEKVAVTAEPQTPPPGATPEQDFGNADLSFKLQVALEQISELKTIMQAMTARLDALESDIAAARREPAWVETMGLRESDPAAETSTQPPAPKPGAKPTAKPAGTASQPPVSKNGGAPANELMEAIVAILPQVHAAKLRNRRLPSVDVAGTSVLLTNPEMIALLEPERDIHGLRGLVGAKVLLVKTIQECKQKGRGGPLTAAVELAARELQRGEGLSTKINGEQGEAWAAALKQLKFILQRARELARTPANA
jgi:hypothetical protein